MRQDFKTRDVIVEAYYFDNNTKDRVYSWAREKQSNIYHSWNSNEVPILCIPTFDGRGVEQIAELGDWVIRMSDGTIHAIKDALFERIFILHQ
jgi:hypothetical protein